MPIAVPPSQISSRLWVLAGIYFLASLAHFAHNAEYIAYYPNMPAGLSRGQVYLVWLAISCVGFLGIALVRFGREAAGLACLSAYGTLGLDGLGHYGLTLCSEHTFTMNATIWSEAISGAVLACASGVLAVARLVRPAAEGVGA